MVPWLWSTDHRSVIEGRRQLESYGRAYGLSLPISSKCFVLNRIYEDLFADNKRDRISRTRRDFQRRSSFTKVMAEDRWAFTNFYRVLIVDMDRL